MNRKASCYQFGLLLNNCVECRADRRKVPSSAPSDDETSSRKRANQKTDDNLADGEQSTDTNGQKSTAKRRRTRGANQKRREEMNPEQISTLHEVNNNEEIDEIHAYVQLIDISVDNQSFEEDHHDVTAIDMTNENLSESEWEVLDFESSNDSDIDEEWAP